MKRVRCTDQDRLIFRQPVGWGVFIALPFYLFFTALGGLMWFAEPLRDMKEGIGPLIFLFFFGIWLIFVVGTAVHWFGRVGVDIDRQAGTATTSWGLLFPLIPTGHRLGRFRNVLLDFQVRQCGKSKISEYVVLLSDGSEHVKLGRGEDYPRMRTTAEEIARFVYMPLIDISDGTPRLVDLSQVSRRPSQDAYRSAPVLPPAPSVAAIQFEQQGDQASFRLPMTGLGCFGLFLLLLGGALTGLYFLGGECHWNWKVMAMWGTISGIVLLILLAFAKPSRQTVISDPNTLTLTTSGMLFSSSTTVSWDEVKELRRDFKLISVLSNTKRLHFGSSAISESEAEWMHEALRRYWRG